MKTTLDLLVICGVLITAAVVLGLPLSLVNVSLVLATMATGICLVHFGGRILRGLSSSMILIRAITRPH